MATNALEIIGPEAETIQLTGLGANLERIAEIFTPGHYNRKVLEDAAKVIRAFQNSTAIPIIGGGNGD